MGNVSLNPKLRSRHTVVSLGHPFYLEQNRPCASHLLLTTGQFLPPRSIAIQESQVGGSRSFLFPPSAGPRSKPSLLSPLRTKPPGRSDRRHSQQPPPPLTALLFSVFICSPWKFPFLFCKLNEASERRSVLFCPVFLDIFSGQSFQIGNGSPFCYSFSSRFR